MSAPTLDILNISSSHIYYKHFKLAENECFTQH